MDNMDFLLMSNEIENLQEEIKRLKRENNKTIKFTVNYNNSIMEIDTQIPKTLVEGKYYYLSDGYSSPSKVKFLGYQFDNNINASLIILAMVCFDEKNRIMSKLPAFPIMPQYLYKSVKEAREAYIKQKNANKGNCYGNI